MWPRRRRTMRSGKLALRRRKAFMWKVGGTLVFCILLIIVSSWLLHRPYLQINNIVVNGNSVISDSDIRDITESILNGKYFFLFPRTNSLIYPLKEIESSILSAYKQIESVDLVRTDFQTLSMNIKEQKPYALWCIVKSEDIQECYFLNEKEGLVFSKAPNFTGNVFFRFYGDLADVNPIGRYYLKVNDEFSRVNVLIRSIRKLDVKPIELRLLGLVDMELYMEDGSKIIFTREQSSSVVLDNLKVVLESETFQDEKIRDIEYIDLRFGNKVYFKLK